MSEGALALVGDSFSYPYAHQYHSYLLSILETPIPPIYIPCLGPVIDFLKNFSTFVHLYVSVCGIRRDRETLSNVPHFSDVLWIENMQTKISKPCVFPLQLSSGRSFAALRT